ncbi:MAG: helix-turn-helix domain-containing protein [Bacteroidota bacterium]
MVNEKSIAVLPFDNLSSDPENEYFSDGMTEEIINALSKIDGLKVTARTSSFVFKKQRKDVRHIGNELGVSLVLEGSVRKAGSRVRITAQLIRTDNGFHIWSENFDRELEDIFQLQDEISLLIADKIREDFGHIDIADQLVTTPTSNIAAYDLYLKGRFFFFSWNLFDIEKAIAYFHQATEIDPTYDQPYYGAALCYTLLGGWGHLEEKEAFAKAERYLHVGSQLGKESVGQKFAQAVYHFWGFWDYAQAYAHLQRAHELNPQDPEPLDFMAEINRAIGDFTTAMQLNDKALAVNPLSTNVHFTRSSLYYLQGAYETALETIQSGLALDPNFELLQQIKVACLVEMGRKEELQIYLEDRKLSSVLYQAGPLLYSLLHGEVVDDKKIESTISEIDQIESPPLYPWDLYLTLHSGDRIGALRLLEEKVQSHNGQVINFKNDPLLAPIREEPAYQQLVQQSFPDSTLEKLEKADTPKRTEVLSEEEVQSFTQALLQQMQAEALYLDSGLTLRSLAETIDLHPNKLSWLLNEKLGKNFSNYINGYRLEAFQKKAVDPANSHLTLLGLAYESGFNSKSVFNEFFKKNTGQTPRAWLKAAEKS